ncbi:hypothetical protein EVAR_3092_1 [Eumeta japonica]|uniref:Uncharacterized protein n=1 Tax=Eumeta variegata TaxID=151549 RepID=A0A4C1STY4_EUMVA|nr:hypothetical protein EVAR_3092_1 [Eumeta japonica]
MTTGRDGPSTCPPDFMWNVKYIAPVVERHKMIILLHSPSAFRSEARFTTIVKCIDSASVNLGDIWADLARARRPPSAPLPRRTPGVDILRKIPKITSTIRRRTYIELGTDEQGDRISEIVIQKARRAGGICVNDLPPVPGLMTGIKTLRYGRSGNAPITSSCIYGSKRPSLTAADTALVSPLYDKVNERHESGLRSFSNQKVVFGNFLDNLKVQNCM